jgi:hypothetical protein
LYFHPLDISGEKLPRVGNGRPFYWIIKGSIIEDRIRWIISRLLEEDVSFCCLRERIVGDI